jgi:hypothetical protein
MCSQQAEHSMQTTTYASVQGGTAGSQQHSWPCGNNIYADPDQLCGPGRQHMLYTTTARNDRSTG